MRRHRDCSRCQLVLFFGEKWLETRSKAAACERCIAAVWFILPRYSILQLGCKQQGAWAKIFFAVNITVARVFDAISVHRDKMLELAPRLSRGRPDTPRPSVAGRICLVRTATRRTRRLHTVAGRTWPSHAPPAITHLFRHLSVTSLSRCACMHARVARERIRFPLATHSRGRYLIVGDGDFSSCSRSLALSLSPSVDFVFAGD